MAAKVKLTEAGFVVQHLSYQPARWGVTPEVFKRQARFVRFIQETIDCKPDQPGCLAARMVSMDGIKPSFLKDISSQSTVPYRAKSGVAIEWLANDSMRLERRLLSGITLKVWPGHQSSVMGPCVSPFTPLAGNLSADLAKFLSESNSYRREKNLLNELELDAICWWHEVLPSSLFAHCTETLVLSAIPRTALARLECRLALAPTATTAVAVSDSGAASDLFDAALLSHGPDTSTALIDTVLDILKEKVSEIDGVNKRHWATEIRKLTNRAINAGPRTALLLAWAADMCESGTIDEINPADSTVSAYIRRALRPLHWMLCTLPDNVESTDWHAANLRVLYQQLVAGQSAGNQPTMRAALSNFHHFLVNWLDIEPLMQPLHGTARSASVKANIVHEHELNLAMQWAAQHADISIGLAAQIMLGIAYEAPVRAQELTRLRLCNVKPSEDDHDKFFEIEIARDATSGRLKTPSSQRRLEVRSDLLIALLAEWIKSRKAQGAPESAFLFGDPNDDTARYKPSSTLAFVSRLLKAATGDPGVSVHTLRHTAISKLMCDVWKSTSATDINRVEVVAADSGHSSGLTSLQIYSHCYEFALRSMLDLAVADRIVISGQTAAFLLGLDPAMLRKRASRARQDVGSFAWGVLQKSPAELTATRASLPFTWREPQCPDMAPTVTRQFTVGVMKSILRDLLTGITVPTLARRYDLNEEALDATMAKLISFCRGQARHVFPFKSAKLSDSVPSLPGALEALGIDFKRGEQDKFAAFQGGLDGKLDDAHLKRGLQSWERCYKGIYLALDRPQDALGLLSLLKLGGADPNALRLCVQSTGGRAPGGPMQFMTASDVQMAHNSKRLLEEIKLVFEAIFPFSPQTTFVTPNRSRPKAYMQWDNKKNGNAEVGASGGSTSGLSAIMICVRAYLIHRGSL